MSRRIRRYTLEERMVHWVAGLSYMYLLLTGLALYSPLLFWLAALAGGGTVARAWHPWAGVIFTVAVLWMYRMWRADMRRTEADRAWNRALRQYVRNEDEHLPPIGRFNPGQKALFWLMLWGGAALFVSGLALWFIDAIPWGWRGLRFAAILIHVAAALLTIGGFIVHVYMGTAVVRGGFSSIIRGEVTEEWAEQHHPLWFHAQKK
jgi:formate dehydrogenase subunit gamma